MDNIQHNLLWASIFATVLAFGVEGHDWVYLALDADPLLASRVGCIAYSLSYN